MVEIAESHDLVVFSDEIYDQMTTRGLNTRRWRPWPGTPCAGRFPACPRSIAPVASAWAGSASQARRTTRASTSWASTPSRRCGCAPMLWAKWAVQTALGGYQSIRDLVRPGGASVPDARSDSGRLQAQQVSVGDPAARGDVRLCAGGIPASCRISTTRNSRSTCSSASTCWWPRAPASTCPIAITSASRFCPTRDHDPGLRTDGGTARRLRRRGARVIQLYSRRKRRDFPTCAMKRRLSVPSGEL